MLKTDDVVYGVTGLVVAAMIITAVVFLTKIENKEKERKKNHNLAFTLLGIGLGIYFLIPFLYYLIPFLYSLFNNNKIPTVKVSV